MQVIDLQNCLDTIQVGKETYKGEFIKMEYTIDSLKQDFQKGKRIKYLFFW